MFFPPQHHLTYRAPRGRDRSAGRQAGQAGTSLIELLVAITLMLVITAAIFGVWLSLSRTYTFAEDDTTAQTQSRMAMAEMVEFIRTARQPLSVAQESLDAVITEAGPFSITMWTDTLRDGTHNLQLVRFRVSPDPLVTHPSGTRFELWREEGDPITGTFDTMPYRLVTSAVANDSAAYPLFTYRDALGAPATDPTRIREVEINLRVDVDPTRSPNVNVLSSIVQPRNLRQ